MHLISNDIMRKALADAEDNRQHRSGSKRWYLYILASIYGCFSK